MPTGIPTAPVTSPPLRSASRRGTAASRGRRSPGRGRSSRRRERSALRHERALVRRRLATPPPDHLSGSFEDPDDGDLLGADGTGRAPGHGPGRRRTRLRLALAALPLAVAVALFAVTGLDSGPGDEPGPAPAQHTAQDATQDTTGPEGSGKGSDRLTPALAPSPMDASVPSDVAEAADSATVAGAPAAPAGHRPVAIRVADPAALSLVAPGDRVDVVGMDGSVLAERVEVLQDRSSGTGPVLVLGVPDGASAALAAAALSREVTVILSGDPPAQGVVQ